MQPKRTLGVAAFALAAALAMAAPSYAGGTDIGSPAGAPVDSTAASTQTGGTTYAAPATVQQPASQVAPAAPVAAQPAGKDGVPYTAQAAPGKDGVPYAAQAAPGKDGVPYTTTGSAPSGVAPTSVVAAPARAGGLVPGTVAAALGGLGLLALSGGAVLRRRA
ncbi:MAG: hypothetical protein IRZ14_07020 [Chloroflexi bacterium]|nr:hypothetical protein [Chloroflexota bacterium]